MVCICMDASTDDDRAQIRGCGAELKISHAETSTYTQSHSRHDAHTHRFESIN